MIGQTLSHYRVTAALGAGGMGEVYQATDTKLNRDVAIKVLPPEVAQDTERLARFQREAQLLAVLNHPNVGAIYGLEEADGHPFLVLELVEGEELQQRLERGAIPVDEAIEIARQIAEGLEAAHDRGVVHRDLKPANVKLTPDGKVKVLDFGLAKAWAGDPGTGASSDLSQSPTLANTGTQAGVILGTAAYMSPEQARGKPVDRRTDVWALGAVLWEMLTGRQLFAGESMSDIVAAVLTREPDWDALPADTPASVRRLLRRTLDRDVRRRLQAIGEARLVLEDPGARAKDAGVPPGDGLRHRAVLAALAGGLVLFAAGWLSRPAPVPSDPPARKVDLFTAGFEPALGQMPVISPDGTRVAYVSEGRLQVRELGRFEALEIPDAEQAEYPSWSPDSSHLVYVRQGRAWKVPSAGGRSTELGAVPDDLLGSGGSTWTRDGRIVIAGSDTVGLWEVPSGGGEGRELLAVDSEQESDLHEPGLLPEDRGILFTVHRRESGQTDTVAVLTGGSRRGVLQIPGESLRYPVYSPSGHLVYERETTNPGIWAVVFSLERLETTGSPFLVVPGGKAPSIAVDGTLCFVRPDDTSVELVRLSRNGSVEDVAPLSGTSMPVVYFNPGTGFRSGLGMALSPDGSQVAIVIGDPSGRLWIYDLARDSLATLADDVLGLTRPVWGSRGQRLLYSSSQSARAWNLSSRRADAAAESERLAPSDEVQAPLALSPNGRWLVYFEGGGAGQNFFKMSFDGSGDTGPVFPSRVQGSGASFSPDGRWLAYEHVESGTPEVYVRRFPEGEGRWQVSTTGGQSPVWRQSGEIFYWGDGGIHAVAVKTRGDSLEVSKPILLFGTGGETRLTPAFDVTPDGQQIFMLRSTGQPQISLIFNWTRDLARIAAENASEEP